MTRSVSLRHLAVCACLVAGISIPVSDLVHGLAHHEAAHHRDIGTNGVAAVSAPEHVGDHPHPPIGRALTARLDGLHAAVIPPRVSVLVEHEVELQPRVPVITDARRWSSTHAPPPGARAPPTA